MTMPSMPDRSDAARARRLARFADTRARGEVNAPADDDEQMIDHLETILGPAFHATSAMPEGMRTQLRENLMQRSHLLTSPVPAPVGTDGFGTATPPRPVAWQSAISLIVVLGFLVTLVGIAYQRIPGTGPEDAEPGAMLGAQVPYDAYGRDIVYAGPNDCVANDRTYVPDDELRAQGMPAYVALPGLQVTTVPFDVAASIQNVYVRYLRCWVDSGDATPDGGSATRRSSPGDSASTYLSDRMRYTVISWTGFDNQERASVDAYYCAWDRATFLTEFPIPLNGPAAVVQLPEATDTTVGTMMPVFRAEDVYRLSDGRYAAVIGSVSSGAYLSWLGAESRFSSAASGANAEPLTVVIFSRVEGTYVIDQTLLVSQIHDAEPQWPRLPFTCMETDW